MKSNGSVRGCNDDAFTADLFELCGRVAEVKPFQGDAAAFTRQEKARILDLVSPRRLHGLDGQKPFHAMLEAGDHRGRGAQNIKHHSGGLAQIDTFEPANLRRTKGDVDKGVQGFKELEEFKGTFADTLSLFTFHFSPFEPDR